MSVFEKNLEVLKEKNELLAKKLSLMTDYKNYEIFQGENDLAEINFVNKKSFSAVYEHPVKDTMDKIKEMEEYQNYPILYFFGLGNAIFYKLLISSNSKLEKVIVFEPDIEIIYIVLNMIDLSEEIKEGKLQLILTADYNYVTAVKLLEDWQFRLFLKLYDLQILTPFYTLFEDEVLRINELNIKAIKHIITSHGNDATDSLIGIKHHLINLPDMLENYKFQNFVKKRNSDIAILVATGPSLTKQLPLLKKVQNYATIISVDASLPILEKHNIKPDIVTTLERVELTSKFFEKTSDEFMKDINFVIASLTHPKTLENIKGNKIITMRPFPFNRFFNLKEYGYAGVGMSAANLSYEVAFIMGYKMVILIGQDLAYAEDGNASHAENHIFGEQELNYEESDLFVTKYGGEGTIRTSRIWNLFKNFFEQAIFDTKGKMVTINSTEGGARIEGATEIPFSEAIKNIKTPKTKFKLRKSTQKNIEKNYEKVISKLKFGIKFGKSRKDKIEKLFLEVAEIWDELVYLNERHELEKINFKKLYKTSDKIDKIKSLFANQTFQKLFFDISQSFMINYELDLAKVQVKKVRNEEEKQAKIVDWIMKHKEWLFTLAGAIDAVLEIMEEELKHIEKRYEEFKI